MLREGIKEGLQGVYKKFSLSIGRSMELVINELSLIKDQTKVKENQDFVQVWFSCFA